LRRGKTRTAAISLGRAKGREYATLEGLGDVWGMCPVMTRKRFMSRPDGWKELSYY